MKKYLIDDKIIFVEEELETYVLEKYKYKQKEVKCCWFSGDEESDKLYSPIYFELRSDLKGYFDYSILKRETLDVIDFISNNFNIRKDLIRIFFNGKDGFYLVIPGIVTGLFYLNNINKQIKKIAKYIKGKIDIKSLRLDIYELDSYHIVFNTENKSTNLFLVNLGIELLNKFTYKELIDYTKYERKERFFGRVDYRVNDIEPSILEVIGDMEDEKEIKKWRDEYIPYEKGVNKNSVKEFYRRCDTIDKYMMLIDEARCLFNQINLESNRFKGQEKEIFIRDKKFDLIQIILNYLYIKNSKYQICRLNDEMLSYREKVICEISKDNADLILYLSTFIIGNEDIFIKMSNGIESLSFEEIIEVTATVYIYLENRYEKVQSL